MVVIRIGYTNEPLKFKNHALAMSHISDLCNVISDSENPEDMELTITFKRDDETEAEEEFDDLPTI